MKRKQIVTLLMAGTLAMTGAPAMSYAEEGNAAVSETTETTETSAEGSETAENTDTSGNSEGTEETPGQTTDSTADNGSTQENSSADPTETIPSETEINPVDESGSTETKPEGASETATGITVYQADGVTVAYYFDTLQHAVNYAAANKSYIGEEQQEIIISLDDTLPNKTLSLTESITITNGAMVCIQAKSEGIRIVRSADASGNKFLEDMFVVSGDKSELSFDAADGATLEINGEVDAQTAAKGSIVNISNNNTFVLDSGVTLRGNNSSEMNGSAINNDGGTVQLLGGIITGNIGNKGAVYTNSDIYISGDTQIFDNTANDISIKANLYLDQNAKVLVSGDMNNANICITDSAPADGKTLVASDTLIEQTTPEQFKTASAFFKYDSEDSYTLEYDSANNQMNLKAKAEPTPVETLTLKYTNGDYSWKSHDELNVNFTTDKTIKYGYFWVSTAATDAQIKSQVDANISKASASGTSTSKNTVKITSDIPESKQYLVIYGKTDAGTTSYIKVTDIDWSKRPAAPTRDPLTPAVTESTVKGLSEPIKFYPLKYLKSTLRAQYAHVFSVTGAGTDNTTPVTGDVRWKPLYWSMNSNGSDPQYEWSIRNDEGVKEAKTYTMYIFFEKQTFDGTNWVDTGIKESKAVQFQSAGYTNEELLAWMQNFSEDSVDPTYSYGDGVTAADLTQAATQTTDSSTKAAADTADHSPIGSMTAMAVLSFLAGGYIVTRKRKNEN